MSTINQFDKVLDALRDVHDEASLWHLADELVKIAPQGVKAVDAVVAAAEAAGIPTKSTNTLRLYRDVAIRFPDSERVTGVSFSAHREAIACGDVQIAKQVLNDLVVQHGAANVTVTTVKKAVAAATGKVAPVPAASKVKAQTAWADVARDLSTGGKVFVKNLDDMLTVHGVTLDGMHAGLSAVLVEVESRRSKAARKAAKPVAAPVSSKPRPAARPGKAPVKAAPVKGGKVGDLRDL